MTYKDAEKRIADILDEDDEIVETWEYGGDYFFQVASKGDYATDGMYFDLPIWMVGASSALPVPVDENDEIVARSLRGKK